MNDPHKPVLKTVTSHEKTAGLQNTENFREDPILQLWRRNVMQHRDRDCAGEFRICKGHVGRIPFDDLDVASL